MGYGQMAGNVRFGVETFAMPSLLGALAWKSPVGAAALTPLSVHPSFTARPPRKTSTNERLRVVLTTQSSRNYRVAVKLDPTVNCRCNLCTASVHPNGVFLPALHLYRFVYGNLEHQQDTGTLPIFLHKRLDPIFKLLHENRDKAINNAYPSQCPPGRGVICWPTLLHKSFFLTFGPSA